MTTESHHNWPPEFAKGIFEVYNFVAGLVGVDVRGKVPPPVEELKQKLLDMENNSNCWLRMGDHFRKIEDEGRKLILDGEACPDCGRPWDDKCDYCGHIKGSPETNEILERVRKRDQDY